MWPGPDHRCILLCLTVTDDLNLAFIIFSFFHSHNSVMTMEWKKAKLRKCWCGPENGTRCCEFKKMLINLLFAHVHNYQPEKPSSKYMYIYKHANNQHFGSIVLIAFLQQANVRLLAFFRFFFFVFYCWRSVNDGL